jgi:hypothetical protein
VALLILLAGLTLVIAAVLWLGSIVAQGWLYNDLARHLPLRALVGGAVMAAFLTAWCAIYRADPGRFDTLVSFKTERLEGNYDEFQSIRKVGKEEKKPVRFVRRGETNDFESVETRRLWNRSDADGMVVALLIQEKGKDQPTRFDVNLNPDGTFPQQEDTKFEAERGRRYMDQSGLGKIYRKRSMAVIGNLFANFLHLTLWVAVLWPVMRFALGHAIAIGLVLWGVTMLIVQPGLFELVTR